MQPGKQDDGSLLSSWWLRCACSVLVELAPVGVVRIQPERLVTTSESLDRYYLKHSVWWDPKSLVCCCSKVGLGEGTKAAVEAEM